MSFFSTSDVSNQIQEPSSGATSFVFGSPEIRNFSFNEFASTLNTKSGFSFNISPQDKGFSFGGPKPEEEENNEEYNPEREASDVHFQPIVQLPDKVEHSTGEEDEEIIYCERAKLFRFEKDVGQWKERGVGNLKLLKHKTTGQVRVLMRRDQVFKLCANHLLTADMELKPNAGSDRSWVWYTSGDISDGETKAEQLAARFKYPEMAKDFKEKFEQCKEGLLSSVASGGDERTSNVKKTVKSEQTNYEVQEGTR